MDKIKWGILSTAKIAVNDVIPAIIRSEFGKLHAVSSRDPQKARDIAEKFDASVSCGSYEELLEDDSVDAIYNPLPNHLHVPWTLKALEAGKHVLCEKPIAPTLAEAEELLEASKRYPDLKVMEAFMYRFHPQWAKVKELIKDGAIGDLKSVDCKFTYHNDDPENIRNKFSNGGGALLDVGCYCISAPRFIFEQEPNDIRGFLIDHPKFGVDHLASGVLKFDKGTATFSASMGINNYQNVKIFGSRGHIELVRPFNPAKDQDTTISVSAEDISIEIDIPAADQYMLQCDAFMRSIMEDSPVPTPLDDAVANMRVIEAFISSES